MKLISLVPLALVALVLSSSASAKAQVHALSSSTRPTTEPRDPEHRGPTLRLPLDANDTPRPSPRVSIDFVGFDDDDEFTVFANRAGQTSRTRVCATVPCTREVPRGQYTLSAGDGEDHVLVGPEPINISRSGRIRIDYRPQHKKRRRMGFATLVFGGVGAGALAYAMRQDVRPQKMMITGGILLGIGFATLMSALFSRDRIEFTYYPE